MITYKKFLKNMALTMLLSFAFAAGINAQDTTSIVNPAISAPVILATSPAGGEMNGNANTIDLGKAGQFVILAKEFVSNESDSRITGLIGEGSKLDSIYIEKVNSDSVQQRISGQVVVFESDMTDSSTTDVNEAIEDMMLAYTAAAEMNSAEITGNKNESFQSVVLTSGVHVWSDTLHIDSDVTLSGSADDVWIIKVGENLIIDENTVFTLTNGARADNVFWYVEGEVTIGVNAQFAGIILSMNEISLENGAELNGRMYSQSSINLDDNTITEPRSMDVRSTSSNK